MELVWGESSIANKKDSISKYCECSDHLQENRITLAFEVVTSVLGDHGDTPKHPYLICTLSFKFLMFPHTNSDL